MPEKRDAYYCSCGCQDSVGGRWSSDDYKEDRYDKKIKDSLKKSNKE